MRATAASGTTKAAPVRNLSSRPWARHSPPATLKAGPGTSPPEPAEEADRTRAAADLLDQAAFADDKAAGRYAKARADSTSSGNTLTQTVIRAYQTTP